jgi:mannitol-1-/sugar-/sorbitol-6-/2-deoxyglucose-6-phosphatase
MNLLIVYLRMIQKAVIFDMDGLLIDSEPYWQEAGIETLAAFGIQLSAAQYHSSTGLRTIEWIDHWFRSFGIDLNHAPKAIEDIELSAIGKIRHSALPMPGVEHIINFFLQKNYRIGLASSSPMRMIDVVVDKLGIRPYLHAITSAGELAYGKPHPQVFINCAEALATDAFHCVCFEDSFNGMIAAKAAKMKCVVVPAPDQYALQKWGSADLKLRSLSNFNELLLEAVWS